MDFEYSEPLRRLQRGVRKFLLQKAAAEVDGYDRKPVFPRRTFREFSAHGFLGVIVPSAYGGTGMGTTAYCFHSEELGRLGARYTTTASSKRSTCRSSAGPKRRRRSSCPALIRRKAPDEARPAGGPGAAAQEEKT